jgi:hypothetical protein
VKEGNGECVVVVFSRKDLHLSHQLSILSPSLSLELTCPQAVRVGDLQRFQAALESHAAVFTADRTYTLILRCAYAPWLLVVLPGCYP